MRSILIALVLLMTVLTFYSALWFKSESIEEDITQRVTDELESSGANGIDVGVDGRHVTLSGIVYDETTEAAYLDTADRTYGALGPIDGLTYLADGGYVTATKTPDGITLRGTVPTQADRVELVAKAAAATDGTVDDQLAIGGADAVWQDEAEFGLAQIAGLSTGAMTVAAGTYVLSGTTDGAVADSTADLAGRDGWTAFVSSPAVENELEAEVDRLSSVVGERDSTIAGLTVDRDALNIQLDGLRANLNSDQAALRAELDDTRGIIAERDQTIVGQTDLIATQQGVIADREASMAEQATLINERDATITGLQGRIGGLEDELAQRQVALGSTDEQVTALRGQIEDQTGTIADLNTLVAQRDGTIADLQSDLDAERANAAASDNDQIAALSGQVADRDATITALNGTVDDLEGTVGTLESTVADLRGQVSNGQGSLTQTAAQIAALTAAVQDNDAQASELRGQVTELTAVVAERDSTIETLRAAPSATPVALDADQCAAQAASALEGSRINFVTNSAEIENASIAVLERLTGIALACVDEDALIVEVGGHTDSDGSEENNQALSQARAQAVVDFMTARGVPTDGLQAVGYGESQPIADNATSEGKAQNRRISFDWQAR